MVNDSHYECDPGGVEHLPSDGCVYRTLVFMPYIISLIANMQHGRDRVFVDRELTQHIGSFITRDSRWLCQFSVIERFVWMTNRDFNATTRVLYETHQEIERTHWRFQQTTIYLDAFHRWLRYHDHEQ